MSDQLILLHTQMRVVERDELHSLIGEAMNLPWWQSWAPNSSLTGVYITGWDPNEDEGVMQEKQITYAALLSAVSTAREKGLISDEAWRDMIGGDEPNLGYTDAYEADCILQLAVYGEIVFG
jgi:hypothetical protein